jgi:hypothetical protein
MTWIGRQAAFYRGYLPDDRSLVPLTVLLSTTLALWLLVYLVAAVADVHQDAGAGRVAAVTFIHNRPAAYSPIARDTCARPSRAAMQLRTIEVASCRTHTSKRQETQARSRLAN